VFNSIDVKMWLNVSLYVKCEFETYRFFEVLNVGDDYDVDSFGDFVMTLVEYDL